MPADQAMVSATSEAGIDSRASRRQAGAVRAALVLEVAWETPWMASAPGRQQVVADFVRPGYADVLDRLRAGAGAP
jgi:hypothetical protein